MNRIDSLLLCSYAMAVAFCAIPLLAQTPKPQPEATLKSKAEDVLLDVVVRDKKGRLVTDLKPDDFQIFDNGEPKTIDAFRSVQGTEAIAGSGMRTKLDPLRQVRLITMIFQSSSPDARRLAHDAAADLLKGELSQNVYVAVMKIDHRLEIVQGFTNDVILLRKAIDRVAQNASTDFSADAKQLKEQLERQFGPDFDNAFLSQTPQSVDQMMKAVLIGIYNRVERDTAQEVGRVDIQALIDVVAEQYRLPGRKTVLYFIEGGFEIPEGRRQWVRNLISVANRSNVSLYAIDTRGLTISDPNHDAASQLQGAGMINGTGVMSAPGAGSIDRANPQMDLAYIAESTGGKLIANTNDFRAPLRKVAEDVETYYEISYAPTIKNYDGSFHQISVKLKSPNLRVQSRSGYFALPPALEHLSGGLEAYEVPLLTALASTQLPHDFDFTSSVMHFRDDQGKPLCVVAIEVPFANVTFQKSSQDHFEARISYMALVKDEKGEVLKKFRNEIPVSVPSSKLAALKASHFTYTEHFDLPPGHYEVEAGVLDSENGNKVGVRKSSLVVFPPSLGLSLSSVSFVKNLNEQNSSAKDEENPLRVGDKVVSPALHPVIIKGQGTEIPFYVVAYLDKSIAAPAKLMLELSKDGQSLGHAVQDIGQPDQNGRVQYLGRVAIASLAQGEYTVRFMLQQGTETAREEAAFFTVQSALSQTPPQPSTTASQTPGASSASQANGSNALLPPGIAIPAELSKSVDAKKVKAGDKIEARVTMDLLSHGQIVVPRDSRVTGHVTEAKARSKESPESTVGIAFDRISLKNGRELSLRTTVQAIGPSLKQISFPENGNEVPGQVPHSMHAGDTPTWRGTNRGSVGSTRPDGSPYPDGNPQDVPAGTVPSEGSVAQATPALDPQSHGVVGMKGLSLSTSDQGSVIRSNTSNIHLDGGTQLILHAE